MLDKKTELMLQVANKLTTGDLVLLRSMAPAVEKSTLPTQPPLWYEQECEGMASHAPSAGLDLSRGERERQRSRESKIATACPGQPRARHDWWALGTELIGRLHDQRFTADVVENPQVKSNRSLRITSGPAQGNVCITPTRAALEATEAFRQANSLGRGGGVTNGWTFWKPAP